MKEAVTKPTLFEVNLRPSRHLFLMLLACLSAALLALWLCSLFPFIKCLLTLVCLKMGWEYYRRYIALQHRYSIHTVRLINNQWRVKSAGRWYRAWPKGEIIVTSFLISCRMTMDGRNGTGYLIICPDSADAAEIHGLRLKLLLDGQSCL